MNRSHVNPSVDKAAFHRTAQATRKVNIAPRIMRGGIRL